jgi:hypothetical protein
MTNFGTFDAYWVDIPNNKIYKVDFQHHSDFIRNNSNLLSDPKDAQRNPYKAAYDNGWVYLVYNLDNNEANIEGHEDKIKAAWRKAKSTLLKAKRVYVDIVKPGNREPTKHKDFGLPHQRDKIFTYFTGQSDPSTIRIEHLIESHNITIELNGEKYGDYARKYMQEIQSSSQRRYDAGQTTNLYTVEEMENDINTLIAGTMENLKIMKAKIVSMYPKFSSKWQGTTVVIEPYFNKGNDFQLNPIDDFNIKLGTAPYSPDFTLFDMGSVIDDVLDAGDKDFFVDSSVESDYFILVQAFQDPSIFDMGEKIITLFTARPRADRNIYDYATEVPANIFLTSDPDEAFGYAKDMNNRDVYKVKVKQKYLVKTLDAGRKKNFQTINGGDTSVPVEMTDRLTEDLNDIKKINKNISDFRNYAGWWKRDNGFINLNENYHTLDVLIHPEKYGYSSDVISDISDIATKYFKEPAKYESLATDDDDIVEWMLERGWVKVSQSNNNNIVADSYTAKNLQNFVNFYIKTSNEEIKTLWYRIYKPYKEGVLEYDPYDYDNKFEKFIKYGTLTEFQLNDLENVAKNIGTIDNAKKILGTIWAKPKLLIKLINSISKRPDDLLKAGAARMMHRYLLSHPELIQGVTEHKNDF